MATFAKEHLMSVVQRIERLEEDKHGLMDDIKEVYSEAEGNGFDKKILKAVIKLRKMDPSDRQEQDALVEMYLSALNEGITNDAG